MQVPYTMPILMAYLRGNIKFIMERREMLVGF